MSSILFGYTMSLTTAATPSTGYLVAYDVDNILKQKDQFGVITQIGSTASGGGINFTTGDGLTFSGSTLSVWVDNSTIQINGLGKLEAINLGPTGPSGDRYKGTSSTIIEVPVVGSVINFDIQPDLAYTYGQSVVMFDYFPGLYVDDYTVDTYGGYIIGEVDGYDKITGSISVVVNYSESVGNTYSQWYVNLSGYWILGPTGSQGEIGPTGSQGITGATGPVGDRYRGTSSTTIEVPGVGYVVNFELQPGLAYSYGQSVVMFDYFPGLYVDDYTVDTYGGYIIGEVDSYDPISGTMAIVVNYSESVGNTYSQWWVNLAGAYTTITGTAGTSGTSGTSGISGIDGDDGSSGTSGSVGAQGPIGPQGVAGPVGPAGLNWQGSWSTGASYSMDDAVGYASASWFCLNPVGPTTSTPDVDNTNWALLASQGSPGPQGPQGIQGPTGPGLSASSIIVLGLGIGSTERCGLNNSASGDCSTVSGGNYNTISTNSQKSTIGGGCCNIISGFTSSSSTISGGQQNTISGLFSCQSTISGGRLNSISGRCSINSTIGGGQQNTISGTNSYISTISGGCRNEISGTNSYTSTISGGAINRVSGLNSYTSTISGGVCNTISGQYSLGSNIGGGFKNTISGYYSWYSNINGGRCSTISGKYSCYSTISGGYCNTISGQYSCYSTISGGYNTISGFISHQSTISGGYCNTISGYNSCLSTISGGMFNTISGTNSHNSTISGGYSNTISGYNSHKSTISGGNSNTISGYNSYYSTISGGYSNTISGTNSNHSTISGGQQNTISGHNSNYSTISGGQQNTISGYYSYQSTIGGGFNNTISGTNSYHSTIGGGDTNIISGYNSCLSTISGGGFNTINAPCSSILGGFNNNINGMTASVIIGSNINATRQYTAHANDIIITSMTSSTSCFVSVGPNGLLVATSSISLSGTNNYVPYYTSSTTLSSTSSIYVTGSNVGIGTITPSAKLHIVGTSSVVNGDLDNSNISLLILNSSGQQSLIVKNDRSVSVNGSAWPYLSFTSSILTISGRTSDSSEYATVWTDSNSNHLAFFRNDGIFSFSRPGTGISKVGINVLPSSVVNDLQVSGTGSFYSVGVGTTTPSYPLHVIGAVSSTTGYNIGATAGFTGTGNYTNFTIIGGIIVSAS